MKLRSAVPAALAVAATIAAPAVAAFTATTSNRGNGATARAVFKPRLAALPEITGTARDQQTLSGTDGTWERQPTSLTRAWSRCDEEGERCVEIPGATGSAYVVTSADIGQRLRLHVTARNSGGQAAATSPPTAVVTPVPPAPRTTAPPTISGTAAVDELLTASPGGWSGSPDLAYQWLACASSTTCVPVTGATDRTFRPAGEHAGLTLRVGVTATDGGEPATETSAATAPVARRTYTQILCANPDTGQGVIADGQFPDGMSATVDRSEFGNIGSRSRCAGTMTMSRGIPVRSQFRLWTSDWMSKGAILRYRAPSGVAFRSAVIHRRLNLAGAANLMGGINGSASDGIFGEPSSERCEMAGGCTGLGAGVTSPWEPAAQRYHDATNVNGFNMFVKCSALHPSWVCGADTDHGYWFYGAKVVLTDTAAPALTTAVSGTLAGATTLPALATLAVGATDGQTGLYRVRVRVDGSTVATRVVDANGGRCADVNPANADAYEFAAGAPCVKAADVALTFDTSTWPTGSRRVEVVLEDAGANTVKVVDRTVTVTA